jgi:hypothetical protein
MEDENYQLSRFTLLLANLANLKEGTDTMNIVKTVVFTVPSGSRSRRRSGKAIQRPSEKIGQTSG